MFFLIQLATMMILVLAANTSFNGFPILASIMAHDKNFPRMFSNRGERLAFHYGIITLVASILLNVITRIYKHYDSVAKELRFELQNPSRKKKRW